MAAKRLCSIPTCDKPHHARGWCKAHWMRWSRTGDAQASKPARVTPGGPTQFYTDFLLTFEGEECLDWPYGKSSDGYGILKKDGSRRLVHRLLCEDTLGPPPAEGYEAAHSCGQGHKGCCNRWHLRWATQTDNQADRLLHGTDSRGEKNGCAKLTVGEVKGIRKLHSGGAKIPDLATKFNVSYATIRNIVIRKKWAWLS